MSKKSPILIFFLQQWNDILNQNSAGAANNAEDFTKQFMSQMFTGSGQQQNVQQNVQQANNRAQMPTFQQRQVHIFLIF